MKPEDMIRELPGSPVDVDAELEGWLRDAYDARG